MLSGRAAGSLPLADPRVFAHALKTCTPAGARGLLEGIVVWSAAPHRPAALAPGANNRGQENRGLLRS